MNLIMHHQYFCVSLQKLKLGRLNDSGEGLYNFASNAAQLQIYVAYVLFIILKLLSPFMFRFFIKAVYQEAVVGVIIFYAYLV